MGMSGEKSMRIHREHRAVFQLLCASQCFPLAVAGLAGTNWTWAENLRVLREKRKDRRRADRDDPHRRTGPARLSRPRTGKEPTSVGKDSDR